MTYERVIAYIMVAVVTFILVYILTHIIIKVAGNDSVPKVIKTLVQVFVPIIISGLSVLFVKPIQELVEEKAVDCAEELVISIKEYFEEGLSDGTKALIGLNRESNK